MNLEYVLRDIQTNRENLIHGWLLSSGSSNTAMCTLRCRRRSRPLHHKRTYGGPCDCDHKLIADAASAVLSFMVYSRAMPIL